MDTREIALQCQTEIVELHRFFVGWFNGDLPDTDAAWSQFENAVDPDFTLISPDGMVLAREVLLGALRGRNASHPPEDGFHIWIKNFTCRHAGETHVVVTYEEWQRLKGEERARLSTAVFVRRPSTPNGVRWLHVHETWLPDQPS